MNSTWPRIGLVICVLAAPTHLAAQSWLARATGIDLNLNKGTLRVSKPDPIGAIEDLPNQVLSVAQSTALLGADVALAEAIRWSRERAVRSSYPLPPHLRQALSVYYAPDVLNRVKISHDWGATQNGTLQQFILGNGIRDAMVADDVIVFRRRGDEEDLWLLAHEVMHVQQFKSLGVQEFARSYVMSFGTVLENEADRHADRFIERHNGLQNSTGVSPTVNPSVRHRSSSVWEQTGVRLFASDGSDRLGIRFRNDGSVHFESTRGLVHVGYRFDSWHEDFEWMFYHCWDDERECYELGVTWNGNVWAQIEADSFDDRDWTHVGYIDWAGAPSTRHAALGSLDPIIDIVQNDRTDSGLSHWITPYGRAWVLVSGREAEYGGEARVARDGSIEWQECESRRGRCWDFYVSPDGSVERRGESGRWVYHGYARYRR